MQSRYCKRFVPDNYGHIRRKIQLGVKPATSRENSITGIFGNNKEKYSSSTLVHS
jgi:hypothetical protein